MCNRADVTSYGAVGDGIVDDTAAIQQAIDKTGGFAYLPTGTYVVSSTIFVPPGGSVRS